MFSARRWEASIPFFMYGQIRRWMSKDHTYGQIGSYIPSSSIALSPNLMFWYELTKAALTRLNYQSISNAVS